MARDDAVIVNTLVRQALVSAQEVMGENGLNTVLRTSELDRYIGNFPPDNLEPAIQTSDYAGLNEVIEETSCRAKGEEACEFTITIGG